MGTLKERAQSVASWLALLPVVIGVLDLVGWVMGSTLLTSVNPGWATMKPVTAVSFIISGMVVFLLIRTRHEMSDRSMTAAGTLSFFLMGHIILFLATGFGYTYATMVGLPGYEVGGEPYTVAPNMPSDATMILFGMTGIAGFLRMLGNGRRDRIIRALGWVMVIASVCALGGYWLDKPWMFFYHPAFSTAMAAPTAVAFGIMGLALSRVGLLYSK